MAIEVRRVRPDDWPEMKRIRLLALATDPLAFGGTLERERAFPDQVWIDRARASAASREVATWVAEDGAGRMVGMMGAHLTADGARLFGSWVEPPARGAGIGGRLLDAVLAWIAGVAPAAPVTLWVNAELAAAVRLYQSRGFTRTGASAPIEHTGGVSIHEMERVLAR